MLGTDLIHRRYIVKSSDPNVPSDILTIAMSATMNVHPGIFALGYGTGLVWVHSSVSVPDPGVRVWLLKDAGAPNGSQVDPRLHSDAVVPPSNSGVRRNLWQIGRVATIQGRFQPSTTTALPAELQPEIKNIAQVIHHLAVPRAEGYMTFPKTMSTVYDVRTTTFSLEPIRMSSASAASIDGITIVGLFDSL